MKRLRDFIAVVLLTVAAAATGARAQEATAAARQARQRDEAAVKEALDGWYTAALKDRDHRLAWWREARFGCFLHWGVYSDPAGEYKGRRGGSYSEHLMRQLTIPRQEYLKEIAGPFNPTRFDAGEWARLFKAAGMRYVVITAKHHDGFAMYPSDVSTFDIADATRFKRDPMKELADACRREGLRFGFYYSHAFDWEHPDAPGNDWDYDNPGGDKHRFDEKTGPNSYRYWYDVHPEMVPRFKKYVDEKAIPQLLELIDKYQPDIFWFDTSGKLPVSEQLRIVKAVREKDPDVVINGRAARGMGKNFGDYVNTADNPAEVRATDGDWEAIPTVNNSYGYSKWDKNYKSSAFFIPLFAKITAKGGNSLLNVGPMGSGEIDPEAVKILQGIGKWFEVNGESIHGCSRTPLERQAWGDSTVKGTTLYLHVFQWPRDGKLVVGGLVGDVNEAFLLADASRSPLATSRINDKDVQITVPSDAPDSTDTVIVLRIKGAPTAAKGRLLATNVAENQLLAFDAVPVGKFTYGDGKAGRYYAAGFDESGDALVWPIRLNAPARFDVWGRYGATKPAMLEVSAGDQAIATKVEALKDDRAHELVPLGELTLSAGEHELRFRPAQPLQMSLFELILKPKP